MPLTKEQKKEIIEKLKEKVSRQKAMVFVAIENLKAEELFALRRDLKKENCLLTVAKKTLVDKVFREDKIDYNKEKMVGQLALIFGFKDELLPAKISSKFSQNNKNLRILGGFFENNFIEAKKVAELAKIPSKKELLTRLIRGIQAPIANFTNVLQGNIKGLITILAKAKT